MGEFWIINGVAHNADGDVGDDNHISYVVHHLLNIYDLDQEQYDAASLDELMKLGMTLEEYNIIAHQTNNLDPRDYAMEKWGWKRLTDNNIETYRVTTDDFNDIYRGLNDAYWDDYGDDIFDIKFNLYIHASRKWLQDIPFDVFENGSVGCLKEFISS